MSQNGQESMKQPGVGLTETEGKVALLTVDQCLFEAIECIPLFFHAI